MRLRKKPWARPNLLACEFFVENPMSNIGVWNSKFNTSKNEKKPLHIELGCGKGGFISKLSFLNHNINYIAIDIKDEVLILAKNNIEDLHNNYVNNLLILSHEIMLIDKIFNENDKIETIYINFCNPWYKRSHYKRRLTHPNQLNQYKKFLVKNGIIHFKTDDFDLFTDSIEYFQSCNFKIEFITYDLHSLKLSKNIMTEHEEMYLKEGKKIMYAIAKNEG